MREDPEFPPIHVLICGDRAWDDDYIISVLVAGLKAWHGLNVQIWEGEAGGADTMAKVAAVHTGIQFHPFPADWERYGPSAGPRRNEKMLRAMLSKAAESRFAVMFGIALHDDLPASKGTRDMVRRLLKADVPVYNISRPLLEDLKVKK